VNFIVLRPPVVLQVLNTYFRLVISVLVHTESFDVSV